MRETEDPAIVWGVTHTLNSAPKPSKNSSGRVVIWLLKRILKKETGIGRGVSKCEIRQQRTGSLDISSDR